MKALVLAGGEGTRLRPLTVTRPKPLVSLVNRPIMGHVLSLLKRHHITEVVAAVSYRANMIQDYFGNGQTLGIHLQYAVEERPLGTAGAARNAADFFQDTFVIISGDVLTDIDLTALIEFHKQHKAKVTLALYRVPNPLDYGIVVTDEKGRIKRFLEKPSWGDVVTDTINAGIYVIEPEVLEEVPPNVSVDWSHDVFPRLLDDYPGALYGYIASGYWADIGTINEYVRAVTDILEQRIDVGPLGERWDSHVWVDGPVEIASDVRLEGPLYLGKGVKIREGVTVHGPAVVQDYVVLDSRALIDRAIIWRNTYVGEGAELHGAIVSPQCTIKAHAVVFEGAVIGDGCIVGEGAIIHPAVKVWPEKQIESGATVRTSLIWGTTARRRLFGRFGITGVVNVDLTPEFGARLGAAIGATFPPGALVTMNRDPHRSSRMLKRALIAGLSSSGVNIWDVHSVPIPVARYYTRVTEAVAGVHVRLSPFNPRVVDIKVFGANGVGLTPEMERTIERVFFREDFRRAYMDDIGTIADAPGVVERYVRDFLSHIDQDLIRLARYNIVVDYAHSPTAEILPDILSVLGVAVITINDHVTEGKIAMQEGLQLQHQQQLGTIVRALGRDLGIQIDVGGEKLFLVDDKGTVISPEQAALAVIDLVMRYQSGRAVAVPVTLTGKVEQVVGFHGGYVVRTRYDLRDLMHQATDPNVILATDGRGHFIFPQFQPVVDGLFAAVKVLELMGRYDTRLSEVLTQVPTFYTANARVRCPWEMRGRVMRELHEQLQGARREIQDGIKVWFDDDRWVLIRPDPDHPLLHLDAEAPSTEEAQALVNEHVRLVEEIVAA